jgi:cyclohexanone monooxygenase
VESPGADGIDIEALREKYRAERDKRLGGSRRELPELVGALAHYAQDPHTAAQPREAVHDTVDVVVVGAGLGGLSIGASLRDVGVERIRMIDAAGDVGGVWYWNRYPGARCDVDSLIYLPLLEEVGGPLPREKYARAADILAHAQRIAKHYRLADDALFHTSVDGMEWDEQTSEWITRTDRGDEMRSQFVVLANGPLTRIKLPAVPGIETFEGHSFHTSRWDYDYTGGGPDSEDLPGLRNKVVGVVGTGATGLQCVPPLGRSAQQLYVFQRTPPTVSVRDNQPFDEEWLAHLEPGWQMRRIENFTRVLYAGNEATEDLVDDGWTHVWRRLFVNERFAQMSPEELERAKEIADAQKMEEVRARIDATVHDRATAEALKPYYAYICKRPGFHDEYLETFNLPNVSLVDTQGRGLEAIDASGVWVDGQHYDVDCLVFATGFEANEAGSSFIRRLGFDVLGRSQVSLDAKWSSGLSTLHGLMTAKFPNLFVLPSPSAQNAEPVNYMHGTLVNARHMAYIVDEVRSRGARTFEVEEAAEDAWVDTILERAVDDAEFLEACTPGRRNGEGRLDARPRANRNFGGGPLEFFGILQRWRDAGDLAGLVTE